MKNIINYNYQLLANTIVKQAAEMQGLDLKDYMRVRKRDGID